MDDIQYMNMEQMKNIVLYFCFCVTFSLLCLIFERMVEFSSQYMHSRIKLPSKTNNLKHFASAIFLACCLYYANIKYEMVDEKKFEYNFPLAISGHILGRNSFYVYSGVHLPVRRESIADFILGNIVNRTTTHIGSTDIFGTQPRLQSSSRLEIRLKTESLQIERFSNFEHFNFCFGRIFS